MTVSLKILISDEDMNRLYAIKKKLGKDDLTPSEFALDILEYELRRMHPRKVEFIDGEIILEEGEWNIWYSSKEVAKCIWNKYLKPMI